MIVTEGAGEAVRADSEATVKLRVKGERRMVIGEGNGPVNALDAALREAIGARLPAAVDASTSPTTRCGCSTPARAPERSPGC